MFKKILIIIALIVICVNISYSKKSRSIFNTKHNLSTSGSGDIKSTNETRVCIFCHTSHNASSEGPLWNHETTSPSKFTTYRRSTMKSKPEQPNGSTKLCLSCHDGTIAVSAVNSFIQPIQMINTGSKGEIPMNRRSNIGTDLRGTHPVSVKYDANLAQKSTALHWPPYDPEEEVNVDANGYVQCTSCHDPHDDSRSDKYPFWKKSTFSEVCNVCHKI